MDKRCLNLVFFSVDVMHNFLSDFLKVVVPDDEFPRLLRGHVTSGLQNRVKAKNPLGKELEKRGVLFLLLVDALDVEGSCFDAIKHVVQVFVKSRIINHARPVTRS